MLNFYKIVKDNLSFNRFEFRETVCLEYTCPIDAEQVGIFSKFDYVVHVLSGKKTYKTVNGEWTLTSGQTLYLRKGAEIIHQYFDDEYCMLGFFLSDELIRETYEEVRGQALLQKSTDAAHFTALPVKESAFLEGYFHSMLNYFRGINRPSDQMMVLKLKELLITLMDSNPSLTTYFSELGQSERPSIREIMENNFCFNLNLVQYAELTQRSLSSFKREFRQVFEDTPGKWLTKRRVRHAAYQIANSDLSISQLAYESGFEDLSHFSRAFKSIMKMSPSEYKKSMKSS